MDTVYVVLEWLMVLALVGLVVVLAWLAVAALRIKTSVMKDAKRLYVPPMNSGKTLVATGKGIAQQETVRAKHIAASAMVAVAAVKGATGEVKTAAQSVHISELKTAVTNVQSVLKFAGMVMNLSKASAAEKGTGR